MAAGGDLGGDDLIECHVECGGLRGLVDELPVVVAPLGGLREGPAYGDGDAFGGESEHHGGGGECRVDAGGEPGGVGVGRGALQGRVDREDGLVGFEEEITGDPYVAQGAAFDVQIDHDEFAAGNLVLTVHSHASRDARLLDESALITCNAATVRD